MNSFCEKLMQNLSVKTTSTKTWSNHTDTSSWQTWPKLQ